MHDFRSMTSSITDSMTSSIIDNMTSKKTTQ